MTSSFMMNAQLPFYNVGRHRSPSVLVAQYTWNSGDDEATDASARHLADFHPSIWGDYFLNYASQDLTLVDDDKAVEQIQELKSEVKRMLVSEDYSVFDKFKGREGNFDASLVNDCIHREMPRLEARQYIETYQSIDSHNEVLLSLAKLDFNLTQKLHQREVAEIARWWKDLDFKRELPFVRDRIAECYLWNLGVYFEPEYSLARKFVTKAMAMITAVDDIYDSYGTIEELELFTRAVERWDINAADELPGYMQVCYTALLDVYSGLGDTLAEEGRSYYLYYMKEAVKIMVRMYFQEAKWFNKQYIPTVEEYMEVAVVTLGYQMLIVASLLGMPEITTEDTFQWLLSNPNIVRASAAICRLMDDIASHKTKLKDIIASLLVDPVPV
ncbi:hypothetical protein CRG98_017884 [Punica granatum]|uniref:Terpene synthase metal-binding domain-containing protein n=1 Tax=Punica granatum TaxID=22663 RepID=A0A2I0K0M5_PUNGR|nr:hypothetical protein CRG98_017884 [Punica granatum]